MNERILLIGTGGREHALAKALVVSPSCAKLWVAPGNPGIAREAELVSLNITHADDVLRFCQKNDVSLVVIGPEQPLAEGLADELRAGGIDVFGPSKAAAQVESSKGFSKDAMQRFGVPTAPYRRFSSTQRDEALVYVNQHELPVVVKYDGLAAGKGVVVATTREEAVAAVTDMYEGVFGDDGIVVEGFLVGQEASVFAITDGTHYVTLAPAQDHKRVGDGDTGKNTGGMGAYAPAPLVTPSVLDAVRALVIEPMLRGLREEGTPFVGCLYCGIMVDDQGRPSVVEFNARFGDPETQAVLAVLEADVAALFASAARGNLNTSTISNIAAGYACNVVLASQGYPDAYEKGAVITGIDDAEADPYVTVFFAGTGQRGNDLVTTGGRVLGVTARGATLEEAVRRSYAACEKISYSTKMYRTDIAARAHS